MKYVLTSADPSASVNLPFLSSLQVYCRRQSARLMIAPLGSSTKRHADRNDPPWPEPIAPYIVTHSVSLSDYAEFYASFRLHANSKRNLGKLCRVFAPRTAILGHPSIGLSIYRGGNSGSPRFAATTGAVTFPSSGTPHGNCGALLVEVERGVVHVRHLIAAQDGSFCDLGCEFGPDGIREARASGLVLPKLAIELIGPSKEAALANGLIRLMAEARPEKVIWFDPSDLRYLNEKKGDVFYNFAIWKLGHDRVLRALQRRLDFIDRCTQPDARNAFVRTERTDGLLEWIKSEASQGFIEGIDANHAMTYFKLCANLPFDVFQWLASTRMKTFGQADFHPPQEPLQMNGVVIGSHHFPHFDSVVPKGPGDINGLTYVVRADSGDDARKEPAVHTACVIYANGNRALITLIDGEWCGADERMNPELAQERDLTAPEPAAREGSGETCETAA